MLNFIYKGIIALIISFGINSISIAEDELLFDDELVFDDSDEEFGEWDDDSDVFGDNDINLEKSFSWLDLVFRRSMVLILQVVIALLWKELS